MHLSQHRVELRGGREPQAKPWESEGALLLAILPHKQEGLESEQLMEAEDRCKSHLQARVMPQGGLDFSPLLGQWRRIRYREEFITGTLKRLMCSGLFRWLRAAHRNLVLRLRPRNENLAQ